MRTGSRESRSLVCDPLKTRLDRVCSLIQRAGSFGVYPYSASGGSLPAFYRGVKTSSRGNSHSLISAQQGPRVRNAGPSLGH